jgi:stringent starvation protein B
MSEMTPNRPYLLRALYDWISDNDMTPHILVDADHEGVDVPEQAVQKGKVILNIDRAAVNQLELGNDMVSFNARFSGHR